MTVPANQKGVIPYINVEGAAAAADFYVKAFGASEITRMPADDGKRLLHCHLVINDGSLMISDSFPEQGHEYQPSHSYTCQLVLDDGETLFNQAVAAGCEVITPFQLMFWGDRWGQLKDPFGVRWAINEPKKD